ncbi:MAG: hypothetical protein Q4E07_00335 [Eubacteriales bacterium]|nr:hypothetical protein [Eubacteriales bacterium]
MWYKSDLDEELYDIQEEVELHEDRMRFAAGMSDFFFIVLGVIVILILVLLLISLTNWLRQDIRSTILNLNVR